MVSKRGPKNEIPMSKLLKLCDVLFGLISVVTHFPAFAVLKIVEHKRRVFLFYQ